MNKDELREKIAAEAARLMLRGKEQDFAAARKRAARWLKKRRLHRDEMPSNQEIQVQMYALSGLMASERDPMQQAQLRHWVSELMGVLEPLPSLWVDPHQSNQVAAGLEVQLLTSGGITEVRQRLGEAGYQVRVIRDDVHMDIEAGDYRWRLRIEGQFPCEVFGVPSERALQFLSGVTRREVLQELAACPAAPFEPADDEHPDAFAVFELLLAPLARVQWPAAAHPEGDALYHSLQVFELGRAERPYDEEFLLACLLHDVGYGINPRHPVLAGLDALGQLITDRTRFFIEQRPVASHYLLTGECTKTLRRHPDFDELVLLARCDRDGRRPGAQVPELEEALEYIQGLDSQWDSEEA